MSLILRNRQLLKICCTQLPRIRHKAWCAVKEGPPDAILGLTEAFKKCKDKNKVNVGVGAYRDDEGKPWVLPTVLSAEKIILEKNLDKEYTTIIGKPEFYKKSIELALGADSCAIQQKRYATAQTISGTGALRIGSAFFAKFWEGNREVYLPNPTWPNHIPVFEHAGLKVQRYRYYDKEKIALDMEGLMEDLCKMPENSIVLFHACAHNPTGIDPTQEQWKEILTTCANRNLYPFFDMAYQGFATGDTGNDAFAVRLAEKINKEFCVAQSYAKNMGLYGERIGALSIICESDEEAKRVLSQMKLIIRPMYSTPPIHGARIVSEILNSPDLFKCWLTDVKKMSDRIKCAREDLKNKLSEVGSKKNWDHIPKQIGMFCYSGLTPEQVKRIKEEFHVYMTMDGRISMAGVSSSNAQYLAESMHKVTS